MAIENLQKSEGIASHKSSLLNSHVSQPGTFFEKDVRGKKKERKPWLNLWAVGSSCAEMNALLLNLLLHCLNDTPT